MHCLLERRPGQEQVTPHLPNVDALRHVSDFSHKILRPKARPQSEKNKQTMYIVQYTLFRQQAGTCSLHLQMRRCTPALTSTRLDLNNKLH